VSVTISECIELSMLFNGKFRHLRNRLLKFCYVLATSAGLKFTELLKQTRQVLSSLYYLDVYGKITKKKNTFRQTQICRNTQFDKPWPLVLVLPFSVSCFAGSVLRRRPPVPLEAAGRVQRTKNLLSGNSTVWARKLIEAEKEEENLFNFF
jgi:hypothetical protein